MSYLETAISTWMNLLRAILLVVSFSLCAYFLVQQIAINVFSVIQDVGLEGDVLKFSLRGKSASAITVPAYQFWTPSGAKLERKSTLTIVTSGLVSTCAGGYLDSRGEQDEIKARIQQIELAACRRG